MSPHQVSTTDADHGASLGQTHRRLPYPKRSRNISGYSRNLLDPELSNLMIFLASREDQESILSQSSPPRTGLHVFIEVVDRSDRLLRYAKIVTE